MTRFSATKAREVFSDVINRVNYKGERIVLERHGKDVVALVPVADLKLLEELEDRMDLREARARLRESGRIALKDVKQRLGLEETVQGPVSSRRRRRAGRNSRS